MNKILILILIVSSNLWSQSNLTSDRPTFSDDPYLVPDSKVQIELGAHPSEQYLFGAARLKLSPTVELRLSSQREDINSSSPNNYLSVAIRTQVSYNSSIILDTDFISELQSNVNTTTIKYLKDISIGSSSRFNFTYNAGFSILHNTSIGSTSITGVYSGCLGYALVPSTLTLLLETYNPDIRNYRNQGFITAILINPHPNFQLDFSGNYLVEESQLFKSGLQVGLTLLL